MVEDAAAPVLGYANPKVFFTGAYRFRSRRGASLLLVALACAVTFGSMALWVPSLRRPVHFPARVMAWASTGAGVVSLSAVVYLLAQIALQGEVVVRVTEHGIVRGGRAWAWGDIAEFGGARDSEPKQGVANVWLTFRPRGRPFPLPLDLTPRLRDEEFGRLAQAVAAYVTERYPHVQVELEPHVDGGGA